MCIFLSGCFKEKYVDGTSTYSIINSYDGKVDYAYRFENGGTSEDYTKASDRLIEIVNKYW